MAKQRILIPKNIAATVLVTSAHTCCKCEERGAPIQIHHIDENPANNDPDNLAVLCLRCHDETQSTGGFARHLSQEDIRLYRDQWVVRVANRRKEADALFVGRAHGTHQRSITFEKARPGRSTARREYLTLGRDEALRYIEALPDILVAAYEHARSGWHGTTLDIVRAAYDVSEVVQEMWLRLSAAFPENHFNNMSATDFLDQWLKEDYTWQHALAEPYGPGTGGTIASVLIARGVLHDLENMIVKTVYAIRGLSDYHQSWQKWLERWNAAKEIVTNA